jgi:histidine ammonia-lyase|tara:strand:- start:3603 stop:5087 length:1485 start_codon:yes stop_codon:yes gene_type:complete
MNKLTITDLKEIINGNKTYLFDKKDVNNSLKSFNFLKYFSKNNLVYGVNTGFGPMVDFKISQEDQAKLQYNLIRSHSSGMGPVLPPEVVKVIMIIRLHTFLQGKSGVSQSLIYTLANYIDKGIYPDIYEHGGVGASGDLVQLAHLALGIIGEGCGINNEGKRGYISKLINESNILPHKLELRDGLAMINGTACMTSLSTINIINSRILIKWSIKIAAMMLEIFGSYDDYISKELNDAKLHKGQNEISLKIRKILESSDLITNRYSGGDKNFQEFYSVRCTPQVLGPILDTINFSELVVENEINSVDDNPIIDYDNQKILHGGNFHGDYVSFEMDKLKVAITKLTMLTERQLNLLLNSKTNKILPPFLNIGTLGLNYGMQGVQFTATSTTAESQMLSNPMSVHSITCNNDNQDIVSMGTNSALITKKVIDNAFQVMSIQLMACVKSLEILKAEKKVCNETKRTIDTVKELIGSNSVDDDVFYNKLKKIENYLRDN